MGLLEWIGESYSPGEVGSVSFGRDGPPPRSRAAAIIRAIIAVGMVGGVYALFAFGVPELGLNGWAIIVGVTAVYLFIAYWVRPAPDTDNIGWLGGMFDHPFRYSDDINRFLIFLLIVLYPGRFIAESLIDVLYVIFAKAHEPPPRRRRRPRDRLREWKPGTGGEV